MSWVIRLILKLWVWRMRRQLAAIDAALDPYLNDEEDDDVKLVKMNMSTLRRWLLYDSGVENHGPISRALKLHPVSDEVDEMERRASDARLDPLVPITPLIDAYSAIVSEVAIALAESNAQEAGIELDEKALEVTRRVYGNLSHASIVGFLAAFMEVGLISGSYPKDSVARYVSSNVEGDEGDDE